jgi:UDP-N-acetylglucosamine--N-acetylmuramyl-(pentapeptide) pyrophosphoryl-undecaprenol N-acetylglucosamine transferase
MNGETSVRVLICAGGTGGGVYPALAVHNALKAAHPAVEILWVGGEGGMEAGLVQRADISFKAIPAAGLHGVGLRQIPSSLFALARGLRAASHIIKEFQPDALFFTGGYVAVPMALAGSKIPALLYVPDIEPGLALKTLAYFAKKITVTSEESKQYFSKNKIIVVTGYPVRTEIATWNKNAGREHLGLTGDRPVVLVFGGSKGAHSINTALFEHLDILLEQVEVLHISGDLDWPLVTSARAALSPEKSGHYHAYPYLHEDMGAALAAADLVVSRAGASVLGELPEFGLPAILVPYPYAWRYQMVNADVLAKRGAALMIEDAKLKSGLYLTIEKLLETPEKLDEMRKAMLMLRTPNAAANIADQLYKIGGQTL